MNRASFRIVFDCNYYLSLLLVYKLNYPIYYTFSISHNLTYNSSLRYWMYVMVWDSILALLNIYLFVNFEYEVIVNIDLLDLRHVSIIF